MPSDALRREYALRQALRPEGPKVAHLACQAGPDELAAKSFDDWPFSVRDRWTAG